MGEPDGVFGGGDARDGFTPQTPLQRLTPGLLPDKLPGPSDASLQHGVGGDARAGLGEGGLPLGVVSSDLQVRAACRCECGTVTGIALDVRDFGRVQPP